MKRADCELLAPAGDLESFYAAVRYGADAVYLGGTAFGMRASAASFSFPLLTQAVDFAHSKGVRVYLTCNIVPTSEESEQFSEFLESAVASGIDACIMSDLGLLFQARKQFPDLELHASTQTGIMNYQTANALFDLGVKRVVLARELSLNEICQIREHTNPDLELEVFVHGSMCMSISGRCLLSQYLTHRDANRGACSQPCRWSYHLMEERKPGQYFPIAQDEYGSYILNAKDLCLIEHLDQLIKAGVTSLKIEGRGKSSYYVAVITNAYRMALEQFRSAPSGEPLPPWLLDEVTKVSHRHYHTGFLFGPPENGQFYENGGYVRSYDVVGIVRDWKDGYLYCEQRNKFGVGDQLEILVPGQLPIHYSVVELLNDEGKPVESVPHATMKFRMPYPTKLEVGSFLRRKIDK